MYMYVALKVFLLPSVDRNLNPLDKKSSEVAVTSAPDESGSNNKSATLYELLLESSIIQLVPAELDCFININLGLNPVNTNGPSALPLPV